jgi:hypothetical protein
VAPDKLVVVAEAEDLDNDAAAVVWDCGLVLAHYLVWAAEGGGSCCSLTTSAC